MKSRWSARAGAAGNARTRLPALAVEYFALGRSLAVGEGVPPAALHAFRLATKRFRYTLELFRQCYGPALEARLGELRAIQTFLGESNDCTVARRLVARMLPSGSEDRKKIDEFLAERGAHAAEGFREHWRSVYDAPGRERAWLAYLTRRVRVR